MTLKSESKNVELEFVLKSLFAGVNIIKVGNTKQERDHRSIHKLIQKLHKFNTDDLGDQFTKEVKESSQFLEGNSEIILPASNTIGVAGMFSKTTVAPLDRIKILLQAHNVHYRNLGVFSGLKEIVLREKFLALYKGNGAQMVRIFPYAATQFTVFEVCKKWSEIYLGIHSHIGKFLSGSTAGVTAVLVTYPLDIIRARLAFQVSGEHVYAGIIHTGVSMFQKEGGVRALYRGLFPTLCGMIPYAGFSFYCFEMMKYNCMKYFPDYTCSPCSGSTGGLILSLPAKLLCGGLAGAIAQSFSYPMDVTRRRMQLAMMSPETQKFAMGMVRTLILIYNENGLIKGLYRGMSINYIRAIPMVAVSFTTYEIMKQALQLDTGMKV